MKYSTIISLKVDLKLYYIITNNFLCVEYTGEESNKITYNIEEQAVTKEEITCSKTFFQ